MAITKPPVLPAWADAGDKVQPSNAELSVGWPVSSTPPSRQRFNWVLNFVANAVRYFSRRGLPDYDAAETYMAGDRTIGDDGKTYKCLVDNTTAFAPSTNPAKWARWGFTLAELDAEGTTPAQFDNSLKRASTAFIQRALGNCSGAMVVTAATTLTAADTGKAISINPGGSLVLPLASACVAGTAFHIYATTSTTVSRQAAETIYLGTSATATSISMAAADWAIVAHNGSQWEVFAGSVLMQYAPTFANSKTGNGYQKLPGGLIIQWGIVGTTLIGGDSQNVDVTFPIAFPNQCLNFVAASGILSPYLNAHPTYRNNTSTVCYGIPSTAGCQGQIYLQTGTAGNGRYVQWQALGY